MLACIPLSGSVSLKDVSDLAGVPEAHLGRVVRMMATAGFLCEPEPGHVAHSALSAPFVAQPSYLDAAMFLADTAAPAAFGMTAATQRFGNSQLSHKSAYNIAFDTATPFGSEYQRRPKLQRQWPAYLRYGTGEVGDSVGDILTCLDSLQLDNNSSVVEVSV